VIVKQQREIDTARIAVSRAELRECLIELWAQIFERELRADLEAAAKAEATEPRDAVR
jgi:hypothetical protein